MPDSKASLTGTDVQRNAERMVALMRAHPDRWWLPEALGALLELKPQEWRPALDSLRDRGILDTKDWTGRIRALPAPKSGRQLGLF